MCRFNTSCLNLIAIWGIIIALSLGCGCNRKVDSRLALAESIMDEHPDSALMVLNEYTFVPNSSSSDSALYGMLLTHARYKNFIDETNDSLISVSARYFLENKDYKRASKSLFLKGMIQRRAGKYGEAAISFLKGMETAQDNQLYLWEGQCAYGLYLLYGDLHDGSSQIKYANHAYKAFEKSMDKGWIQYSKLMQARAYNNNCQYDMALSILENLISDITIEKDVDIMSQIYQLRGLSLFALGKYQESIDSYIKAYNISPTVLTANDFYNLKIGFAEISQNSSVNNPYDLKIETKEFEQPFVILAREGKYKDAYQSLELYKNQQDSVLTLIFKNNVAESINQHEMIVDALKEEKIRNERMIYWCIFCGVVFSCILVYWRLRERVFKERSLRFKIEADLESLRSDLLNQLNNVSNDTHEKDKNEKENEKSKDFIKIIRQRYAETNELCDDYYQGRVSKSDRERVSAEIKKIVKSFTEKSGLEKVREYVDKNAGGLYTSFIKDFYDLSEENKRLYLYLLLGFNSRTISVILAQEISAVYNKKSRLKAKISKSEVERKEEYLKFF